jgi:hypothetical protein
VVRSPPVRGITAVRARALAVLEVILNWVYSVLAILAGIASFEYGTPVSLPVFGLAFGAAALLRESRSSRRFPVLFSAALGCLVCGLVVIVRLLAVNR